MKSVYVMKSGSQYKIGISKEPEKRLHDLSIGNCDITLIYKSDMLSNAYSIEKQLHKIFHFASAGREWFANIEEEFLLETVKSIIEQYGNKRCEPKEYESVGYVKCSNRVLPFNDWISIQKKEIEEMTKENDSTSDLVSMILRYPEIKNVVRGLIGLGCSCADIKNFICSEIYTK